MAKMTAAALRKLKEGDEVSIPGRFSPLTLIGDTTYTLTVEKVSTMEERTLITGVLSVLGISLMRSTVIVPKGTGAKPEWAHAA